MKTWIKRLLLTIVLVMTTVSVVACDVLDQFAPDVRSIDIVPETLEEKMYLDTFEIGSIQLKVITANWNTQYVDLRPSMLNEADRDKLAREGTHRIEVTYRGATTSFDITLHKRLTLYFEPWFPEATLTEQTEVEGEFFNLVTFYYQNDALIGVEYYGLVENNYGIMELALAYNATLHLIEVMILETDNSPIYIALLDEPIENLAGQWIDTLTYDVLTGATASYRTIKNFIDATVDHMRRTLLDPYEDIYLDYTTSTRYRFNHGPIFREVRFYEEDTPLGLAYETVLAVDLLGYPIAIMVDDSERFLGLTVLDRTFTPMVLPAVLETLIDDYNARIGDLIETVYFAGLTPLHDDVDALIDLVLERMRENTDVRTVRQIFDNARSKSEPTPLIDDILSKVTLFYDGEGTIVGYMYRGSYAGHNETYPIVLDIAIDTAGVLMWMSVVDHMESLYGSSFELLHVLIGATEIDEDEVADVISGATLTGNAIIRIIRAALNY